MTQMIYRPQTGETLTKDRKTIEKVLFKGIPLDALVVEEGQVDDMVSQGWFVHPDDMLKEPEGEPKPRRGRKANDRSDNDSQ